MVENLSAAVDKEGGVASLARNTTANVLTGLLAADMLY
jgi:hypothetical protein